MVRVEREHVAVFVAIVIRVRDFFADVDVFAREPRIVSRRDGIPYHPGYALQRERLVRRREVIDAERGMRIIETGIQDRHNDAVALVFGIRAVEDTRFVNVDLVGDDFADGGGFVFFAHDHRGIGEHVADFCEILRAHPDLKSAEYRVVCFADGIADPRAGKFCLIFGAFRGNAAGNVAGVRRRRIFRKRHAADVLVIGIENGLRAHIDDQGDLLVVGHRVRELIDDIFVVKFFRIRLDGS